MESIYPETGSYITPLLLLLSPSIGQKDWKLCDHYHHKVETITITITFTITIIMSMIVIIRGIFHMILAQKMIN